MAENGEEKLIAVARHIAKTLGHNDTMADDILQIFSNFDGRLRDKLSEKLGDNEDPRAGRVSLEQTLNSLHRRISRFVAADQPIWSDSADSSSFLEAVDELLAAIRDWTPTGASLDRADDLLQQAMFRLDDEFRLLMERGGESFDATRYQNGESGANRLFESEEDEDEDDDGDMIGCDEDHQIPVAHPISDYDIVIDALPSATINDLHEIGKRMVAAGFAKECAHAYSTCRREFLDESFSRLGLRLGLQNMPRSELEDEIERWIKAMNVAVRILLPSERHLCDRVFSGSSSAADLSFMEVCRGSTVELLNFADALAIGSRSPERLFKVLDVFEAFRDLIPEFEALFCDQYTLSLRNEALTIWKRLGEAIRGIFMELENLIRRDPAKVPVPGGGLHPITRYVMNYLRAACRSRQTLEQVFEENVSRQPVDPPLSSSSLSIQMAWTMELLESNLESKSKIYRDTALCSVFMMNNGRYIVEKVKDGGDLGSLLGDDWIRKHTSKLRQYQNNYQRSTWNKVLGVLKPDNSSLGPNVGSKAVKEKLNFFNLYFEEICKTQSTWVIFDDQLRDELRGSVAANVSSVYRNFIGRSENVPDIGRHQKYSVEELEARISGLFRGSGGSVVGRN